MMTQSISPPLIAHVIYHLGVGGLENGLVNLINHLPQDRYRHVIICLKGYTDFSKRIKRSDVEVFDLNKPDGLNFSWYVSLYRLLRQLKPDIVHTRNFSTLEGQIVAALARINARVHGEHGRDILDLEGKNRKYNLLRQSIRPLIHRFITVSKDLERWLINTIKVEPAHIKQIYNGVDNIRFSPRSKSNLIAIPSNFITENAFVIGSVGRMAKVKDYLSLTQAFLLLVEQIPQAKDHLRLLIVGDGESRKECIAMLRQADLENLAWLPGERSDVSELMQLFDVFVLPSLAEGISNTILEAMSCGLPVIATSVGGNVELVINSQTGKLVPSGNPEALATAILEYYNHREMLIKHGQAARQLIETNFSIDTMVAGYLDVYDEIISR